MLDDVLLFTTGSDTYIDSLDPDVAHDDQPYAPLIKDQSVYLIRQGIGNVEPGAEAVGCTAGFTVDSAGTVTFKLYRLAGVFDPETLYADAPGYTADTPLSWTGTVAAGDRVEIDVTSFVALALANPATYYGWALVLDTPAVTIRVATLTALEGVFGDDITTRPTLRVPLSSRPDAPTDVYPNSGCAVGVNKPWVGGRFGDDKVTGIQVQIKSSAAGFDPETGIPSPTFNSGELDTTDPSLNLASTAYLGIIGTPWMTMRMKGSNGSWSQYSPPVSFRYAAKLTATILTTGPVGDPQTTVEWDVLTGTQTKFQLSTHDAITPATDTSDSEEQIGAATSWDTGYLAPDSRLQIPVLRLWDDVPDRQATPGCPIYTEIVGDGYYSADDLTVDPPTDVGWNQIGESPWGHVNATTQNPLGADDKLILIHDEVTVGRYTRAQLPPPEDSEAGPIYRIPDWTLQPWTEHVVGVKITTGGRTSEARKVLVHAQQVTGIHVASIIDEVVAQCGGTDRTVDSEDQVGIQQALGDPYVSVQISAIGQRFGTLGGEVTDFAGQTATAWVKAWRFLKNHAGRTMQIAYGDTSFEGRIWGVNIDLDGDPDRTVSPYDKVVKFRFAQTGLEHLVEETVDGGQTTNLYDFEEGTDGAAIIKESLGGSPGVIDKTGGPKYSAAAAIHGALGFDNQAAGSALFYRMPNPGVLQVYVRLPTATGDATNAPFIYLKDVNGVTIVRLGARPNGKLVLENNAGQQLDKTTNAFRFGTTADEVGRVAIMASWVGGFSWVTMRIYTHGESSVYDDILFATAIPSDELYEVQLANDSGHQRSHMDSVRVSSDASAWPLADEPDNSPTHLYSLTGGRTATGFVVVSQLDPDADPAKSVDLAVSTSAAMTSPVLVGVQTVDEDGLVRHTVTGKAAGTRYYYRLVADGSYFGQPGSCPTAPVQTGNWTENWILGSCLSNGGGSAVSLALDDAAGWGAQSLFEMGDRGYWGQGIEPYPLNTYQIDLKKHRDEHANYPARRALEQSISLDGDTDSDHEFHSNGDGEGAFGCLHSVREIFGFKKLMPVRVWGDPSGGKHRGYYYDLTPNLRVVVSDFRSPERNNANDPEGPLKGMWGAPWNIDPDGQENWLFTQAFNVGAHVGIVFVSETSWWRKTVPISLHSDKPASYPDAQARFMRRLNATGEFAGMSNIRTRFVWFGGDRHYCGVCTAADNPDGFPQIIGSGWWKNCLELDNEEIMTWTTPTKVSSKASEQFDVAQYTRVVTAWNAATQHLTLTARSRASLNTHRVVNDGVTTIGDKTVTSATAAFTTADVGQKIGGLSTGDADLFPVGARIASRNSATSVELDQVALASATGAKLTIFTDPALWTMSDWPTGGPTVIDLDLS